MARRFSRSREHLSSFVTFERRERKEKKEFFFLLFSRPDFIAIVKFYPKF